MIGSACFNDGHALEGLDGGAREDGRFYIASGFENPARRVNHAEGSSVAAFNNATTGDFGDDRIGHVWSFH